MHTLPTLPQEPRRASRADPEYIYSKRVVGGSALSQCGRIEKGVKCYHANREAIVGSAERITKNFLRHASGVIRAVGAAVLPNHKYSMETFVMLIMLLHLDPTGYPYTTTMTEDPQQEYTTLKLCESAAVIRRDSMLRSSLNYPDLAIIDIRITCLPAEFLGTNEQNLEI